ncbi:MAG: 5-(carboxyamino)imidazole ribonucleotide mutase, partial [Campylobacterota bacterium]
LNDEELRVKLHEDRVAKARKVELDSSEVEVIL